MDDHVERTLSWLHSSVTVDRMDFVRSLLKLVPLDEMKIVKNLWDHALKRKKEKAGYPKKEKPKQVNAAAPEEPAFSLIPAPSGVVALPGNGWWSKYNKSDVVALDCEMVAPVDDKRKLKLATIAIYNYDMEKVYNATVLHRKGSFIVNRHTLAVNGFNESSLVNGRDFNAVVSEVNNIIRDKLVIVYGGINDFMAMDLDIADYDVFDLSTHFTKWYGHYTRWGEKVLQPINSRSVYYYYTKVDIQRNGHNADDDALATMKLFELYVKRIKTSNVMSREHSNEDDEYEMIVSIK